MGRLFRQLMETSSSVTRDRALDDGAALARARPVLSVVWRCPGNLMAASDLFGPLR